MNRFSDCRAGIPLRMPAFARPSGGQARRVFAWPRHSPTHGGQIAPLRRDMPFYNSDLIEA